jgi:LemA protein
MMWLFVIAIVVILAWPIWIYNRLVRLRQRAKQAFADIDAQLKRRHDLVPALVETVKGYASHESTTLEEVTSRRAVASEAADKESAPEARAGSENMLAGALRKLFALAEDYPDLKANERFGLLQTQLAEIEDQLQHARRYYNAVVRDMNTAVATFPDMLVAGPLGFRPLPFFELDSPLERAAAEVKFDDE